MAVFNSAVFYSGVYFTDAGAVVKTGTGGIDPGEGIRRKKLHLPVKPTGFLDRPKAKDQAVQGRLDDAGRIEAEIAGRLAREFGDESQRIGEAEAARTAVALSMAEVDREIGALLRKKLRTEEDEVLLLLLMVAASA